MKNLLFENLAISTSRKHPTTKNFGAIVTNNAGDIHFESDQSYFFPLYLYPAQSSIFLKEGEHRVESIPNFTPKFLEDMKISMGKESTPEEIFYYIYAVLYSSAYRKRYEEFLKIDFPRVPLLSDYDVFKELSNLGKELVDIHLLKAPALDDTEIGFPKSDSNNVEKVFYDERNQRVFINKEQYFEGVSKEVWEYRIGAYQVLDKYLKDRKKRKLSLAEIDHYMKVAKAIRLTIELQEKIDDVYKKLKSV